MTISALPQLNARSRAFNVTALAPLGFVPVMDLTKEQTGSYAGTGFGPPGRPHFWIGEGAARSGSVHIAFNAKSRAAVDAFYRAAIAASGRNNGAGIAPALSRKLLRRFRVRSGWSQL